MANTVEKVLKIAAAEVGYMEKSRAAYQKDSSCLDEKTRGAGSDNYTKYGRDMHKLYPAVMDFPAAWCDCFVDWCFQKAYGVSNAKKLLAGNFDDYTVNSAQLYKNKNAWHTKPKVGDQIFFKNDVRICHTGLVYKVDADYVYTIEGNTSNASGVVANGGCVAYKKYSLGYSRIAGYGRPKYDVSEKAASSSTPTASKKTIPTLASASPNLKRGSRGEQVKSLQKDLNYVMGSGLDVDGDFGSKTEAALKSFQKKYKLEVDGIYGTKSKTQMKKLLV